MPESHQDQHPLDGTAALMMLWKSPTISSCAVTIVRAAWAHDHFWPDELDFSRVEKADRNCIGAAFRLLIKSNIIERTDRFRRSTSSHAKGRTVFAYRIGTISKAKTFLERQTNLPSPTQQLNLAL